MKQIYSIIFASLMALFLLPACSEDIYNEYNYDPSLEEGLTFSFTPGDMTFSGAGGSITANIETKKHWVIIIRDTWLTVSKNSGDGNAELTFTATPLPYTESERYTEVEIFISDGYNSKSYQYNVIQRPGKMPVGYLEEYFEDGIPDTWYTYKNFFHTKSMNAAAEWTSGSVLGSSAAKAAVSSSFSSVRNDCECWLITPPITNPDGELYLTFDSFAELTGNNDVNAEFEVYLMSDSIPGDTDIQLHPILPTPVRIMDNTPKWTNSGNIKLDQMTGIIYIGFRYAPTVGTNFANSTEWYITNVGVGKLEGPEPDNPLGLGTSENPYNISYVNSSTGDLTDVWVAGYVVGYVEGTSFDSGAIFATGDIRTNIIISENQEEYSVICPAQLPAGTIRDNLNLSDNPYMLGGYIQVRCDISTYFGRRGIRNITDWYWSTPPSSRAKTRR